MIQQEKNLFRMERVRSVRGTVVGMFLEAMCEWDWEGENVD